MSVITWLIKRLIDPVAILWLGLLVLTVVYGRKKNYQTSALFGFLAVLLTVFGGTSVSHYMVASLERPYYSSSDPKSIPEADVVLVLGGYISHGQGEVHGFDTGDAFDRLLTGLELIRYGKGQLLLLGGGSVVVPPNRETEFSKIEPWITRWGLVDVPVEHIGIRANTFEEARAVKNYLENRENDRVILVTSALHMRRAQAVFESAGVKVSPVACDFISTPKGTAPVIPSSGRLRSVGRYLHEKVGWYHYRLRGWITEP